MDFDKKLKRLEEIIQNMESGEVALEKSLSLFEEGIKLSRECHSQLSQAEQKVQQLLSVSSDGKPQVAEFKT